ncbi:MAG: hypothetical protein ACI4KM_04775 [Oscillospiraceae bacterium]
MDEVYSADSFIRMLLSEYTTFRKVSRYNTLTIDPKDETAACFIFGYQRDLRIKKAQELSQSREAILEYSRNRKKNKYILLEAMDCALAYGVISEAEFAELFGGLTGKTEHKSYDSLLTIKYKYEYLFGCIDDFFINKGYSVVTGEKKPNLEEQQISYTNELEMWCEYCKYARENGIAVSGCADSVSLNEEYILECASQLEIMNESKADESFVPLYFDAKNGAGIYIIGSKRIPKDKRTNSACRVCVTYYYELLDLEDDILTLDMEVNYFDTVAEACSFFRENSFMFYEHYYDDNSCRDISKVRAPFRQFFERTVSRKSASEMMSEIENELYRTTVLDRAKGSGQHSK